MASFYLNVNKERVYWFGEIVGSFKVAIAGDGAPFKRDVKVVVWLVKFPNCRKHVSSSAENFRCSGQIAVKTVNLFVDFRQFLASLTVH